MEIPWCFECKERFDHIEDSRPAITKAEGYGGRVFYEGPAICPSCCERYITDQKDYKEKQ